MILVTVGTTHFDALVEAVDLWAGELQFDEPLLFQIGSGSYEPINGQFFRFKPSIDDELAAADLVVTHGGATVFSLFASKKRFVAVANTSLDGNHQERFLRFLAKRSSLVWTSQPGEIGERIRAARELPPASLDAPSLSDNLRDYIGGPDSFQRPGNSIVQQSNQPTHANYRIRTIQEHVDGKRVLGVGCVDHDLDKEGGGDWLHRLIRQRAAHLVGLDMEESAVRELNELGYRIVCGNAESTDLGETFDVVVAGELIEHVDNPGSFLRNMRRHLIPGGELIMTTPNPFYPKRLLEILRAGQAEVNGQHVSWFCPTTLAALLERAGFVDIQVTPFNNSERMRWLVEALGRFRPWWCTNLMVIAKNPA